MKCKHEFYYIASDIARCTDCIAAVGHSIHNVRLLANWDGAVASWKAWEATWATTKAEEITAEGQAYVDAILKLPDHWRTPNQVAQGS